MAEDVLVVGELYFPGRSVLVPIPVVRLDGSVRWKMSVLSRGLGLPFSLAAMACSGMRTHVIARYALCVQGNNLGLYFDGLECFGLSWIYNKEHLTTPPSWIPTLYLFNPKTHPFPCVTSL